MRVKRGLRSSKIQLNQAAQLDDFQDESRIPTDPYFPLQWYLRNTGQNGGKVHLDLNVQAAWDQGITGKNITTAIMDDGQFTTLIQYSLLALLPLPDVCAPQN